MIPLLYHIEISSRVKSYCFIFCNFLRLVHPTVRSWQNKHVIHGSDCIKTTNTDCIHVYGRICYVLASLKCYSLFHLPFFVFSGLICQGLMKHLSSIIKNTIIQMSFANHLINISQPLSWGRFHRENYHTHGLNVVWPRLNIQTTNIKQLMMHFLKEMLYTEIWIMEHSNCPQVCKHVLVYLGRIFERSLLISTL